MRFVSAGREAHASVEVPETVRFPTRFGRADIPHDGVGPRIENPRGRGPGRLLIILPVLIVASAKFVGPRLRADSRDLHLLRCCKNEYRCAMLVSTEITNIDEGGTWSGILDEREQ